MAQRVLPRPRVNQLGRDILRLCGPRLNAGGKRFSSGQQILPSSTKQPVPLIIGGTHVQGAVTHPLISPLDGRSVWDYSSASLEQLNQAIEAATTAFPGWAETKPAVRCSTLLKAADIFTKRSAELKEYMKIETGADDQFIAFNISATVAQLKDIAMRSTTIHGLFPSVDDSGRSAIVLKEPYGVVAGIAPWNAPYILGVRAASAALATGNTVVLKGSERSPRCYRAIVDVFHEAGLPPGCLNLVFSSPESAASVTKALIKHPAVRKINFTGSTAIGSKVASLAGQNLKPVLLELGGKASAIVFEDANLAKAADACVLGAFLHGGQVCMATDRILVHSSIVSEFTAKLTESIKRFYPPHGPSPVLISHLAEEKVEHLVSDAVNKGAVMVSGRDSQLNDKPQFPLILGNVSRDMDIFYTETFGPVATLHTFDTEEEALAIANDTEYGLAGAIFTEDLAKGLRVGKKYTSGSVHINAMSIHDEPNLPHGGTKSSGFGRFNTEYGLNEFLRTKVITWRN
ncbi:hypothetical protein A1O1_08266 [Capronia coronata CBS 617.96]|uniref:Aldehyde dehydrogenase domain-containing protein n=1 Tax=Capronia coronata CBS 617.96 TaxID=1182541 RepID=W9YCR5_9EURO|nr:uncharacterized protein A1O1_08266 [Capronia coronata CBS 617.96]EXJ80124.1 hypothetical protein A1O1_08266 [Capronia coronata CBS 617.96]